MEKFVFVCLPSYPARGGFLKTLHKCKTDLKDWKDW